MNTPAQCGVIKPLKTDIYSEAPHTILEEWAYIRPWTSEQQRQDAYQGFLHYYNHHRTHSALNWNTPDSTIGNNLPGMHT